jgi:hypothetical protein
MIEAMQKLESNQRESKLLFVAALALLAGCKTYLFFARGRTHTRVVRGNPELARNGIIIHA